MAVIIVIGLLVVGMASSFLDSQNVGASNNKLKNIIGSSGISIIDVVADSDGDAAIVLKNLDIEKYSIDSIRVGDNTLDYDHDLSFGGNGAFYLSDLGDSCTCGANQKSVVCNFFITRTSQHSIQETIEFEVSVDCVDNVSGDFITSNSSQTSIINKQTISFAKTALSDGDNMASVVATDSQGNSYVGGLFRDTLNFGGEYDLTATPNTWTYNLFFAKYDSGGNLEWSKSIENATNTHQINGLEVDSLDNVYGLGYFYGDLNFGGDYNFNSVGYAPFIAKYDSSGNLIFAKSFYANGGMYVGGSKLINDYIYFTGYFDGDLNFGGDYNLNVSETSIYFAKSDLSGNIVYAKEITSDGTVIGSGITADSAGNIYLTGSFSGNMDFGESYSFSNATYDAFIAKYDSSGNILWVKVPSDSGNTFAQNIEVDSSGNVYACGYANIGVTLDFENGHNLLGNGFYLVKYDSDGNSLWAKDAVTENYGYAFDIELDSSENIYEYGRFKGDLNFGGDNNISSKSGSSFPNIFLVKYLPTGEVDWAQTVENATNSVSVGDFKGNGLEIDLENNVYISGDFYDYVDFGNSNILDSSVTTTRDFFIAKYGVN